uniref:Transmembrane protein n=1 Tax=Kofleria flava TaxID=694315 RepID=A0A3S5GXM8_9BACT|nr:hypothetical protein [Kofleria flava]
MLVVLLVPAMLQAMAMLVDEAWYHRRRGLPRWERLGHPVDTLSVALCYGWLLVSRPDEPRALYVYVALAFASSLLVTKDEPVHARECDPGEQWLHAVLFVLHPIVFVAFGFLWWSGDRWIIMAQLALTIGLMIYQLVYWSVWWKPRPRIPAR